MKSRPLGVQPILATDHNTRRDDARGGSFLLAHQQLGALALPTNPTNGQTLTLTVNGTAIVITYVSSIGSTPNNVLIQGSAALTAAATVNFLRRPDVTNSNQIAAAVPNQALLVYLGWSLPAGATTITPFSLNKNVNSASANLTSFTASTTVTGASWTAQTMQLYVEEGTYYVGTTRILYLGGSTPTVTAPVSNPRIDVLTADSSGTLAWTTGTESASPVAPSYPVGKLPICELYNVVGETALYDNENQQSGEGYISSDVRPVLGGSYISSAAQVASGLFILDPGSEAQGDILYYTGSAWALLPPGTSGQFLKTLGAGANPQWGAITVGETDGTVTNQSLTATTSLQTDNVVVTHGLGRTPAFIRLSCQVAPTNNPSSGVVTGQMDMTYNGSGTAVAGFCVTWLSNSNSYTAGNYSFGGAATTFVVAGVGAIAAATMAVSITSISSTQFTIHITYQVTTGSGTLTCTVNNISWAVIG
jgi:hypothetical protein